VLQEEDDEVVAPLELEETPDVLGCPHAENIISVVRLTNKTKFHLFIRILIIIS
jgi:hypothetical protein